MLNACDSYLCFIFYAIRCCLAIVILNDWPILIVLMLIRTGDSYANVNLQNEFGAEKPLWVITYFEHKFLKGHRLYCLSEIFTQIIPSFSANDYKLLS